MNKVDDPWIGEVADGPDAPLQRVSALIREDVEGVVPLDTQFGVREKRCVPDVLRKPMFEGGAGALYVLLDGARLPGCREMLEAADVPHRCLYRGEAYDALADEAPWVAELTPDGSLTRALFTRGPAPWHMWDQGPHLILRGQGGIDGMWRHLRRFNRAQDEAGKWFYLRYWEPSVVGAYFTQLADIEDRRQAWFRADGASDIHITRPAQDAVTTLRLSAPEPVRSTALRTRLLPQDRVVFGHSREAAFFVALGAGMASRNAGTVPLGLTAAPDHRDWTALARAVARHAKPLGIVTQQGLAKLTALSASLGLAFWEDLRFDLKLRQTIATKSASEAERLSAARDLYDKTDVETGTLDAVLELMARKLTYGAPDTLRHVAPKTLGVMSDAELNAFAITILRFDADIESRPIEIQRIAIALGAALGVAWLDNPFYHSLKAALLSDGDPSEQVRAYLSHPDRETAP